MKRVYQILLEFAALCNYSCIQSVHNFMNYKLPSKLNFVIDEVEEQQINESVLFLNF